MQPYTPELGKQLVREYQNNPDAFLGISLTNTHGEELAQEAEKRNPNGWFGGNIGKFAEDVHGKKSEDTQGNIFYIPEPTKDAAEKHKLPQDRSKDIGFGHKIKDSEIASGKIHGIRFIDDQDNYIPLNTDQLRFILHEDMYAEIKLARDKGWDQKLKDRGSSWDKLDQGYRDVLTSLAFNVGGTKAEAEWEKILDAAINKDVKTFAKEARRNDNGVKTAGMDNRVLKELFYANLIKDASEVSKELPLANANQAGVPDKI